MNDQIRRRVKTKYKRGLPLARIAIDIELSAGVRLTIAQLSSIVTEPIESNAPLSSSEKRQADRKMRRARCLKLRKLGWMQGEIAEEIGVSVATVGRWLKAAGLTRRRRSYSQKTIRRIRDEHGRGRTVSQLAASIGAPTRTIYRWLSDSPKADHQS